MSKGAPYSIAFPPPVAIDAISRIDSRISMLSDPQRDYIRKVARTLQIIVGALAGGALMFMAVVIFLVSQNPPAAAPETPIITYVAYGLSVFSGIASLVVPSLISNRARQSLITGGVSNWGLVKDLPNAAELGDVAPLAAIYQTRTITSAALVQGAVFLACVAYLLEHQRPVLIAAGVLLLMIISKFPTVSGLESSIETDAATVQQMRQLR
jgi:hypothetical protein